jgi:glycosyltransferase involved in cell wall biosynthesis
MSGLSSVVDEDPRTDRADILMLGAKGMGVALGGADLRQAALVYGLRLLAPTDVLSLTALRAAAGCVDQCGACGSFRGEKNVPFYWYHCAGGESRLSEVLRERRYKVVVVSGLWGASYLDAIKSATSAKVILDEHNAEADLLGEMRRYPHSKFKDELVAKGRLGALESFEGEAIARADAVAVCSETDRIRLHRRYRCATPMFVVQNGVRVLHGSQPHRTYGPDLTFFLGKLSYFPNAVAAHHVITRIGPLVARTAPKMAMIVAGRSAPAELETAASGGPVRVKPDIADVEPLFLQSVMVVPLEMGGGSRLKILQAFAAGSCSVVASEKAMEGIEAIPGRHFLLARDPDDFAAAIREILADPHADLARRREAWNLTGTRYSWSAVAESVRDVVRAVGF